MVGFTLSGDLAGAYRSMALLRQIRHKLLAPILFHKKILTLLSGFPYHFVTWLGFEPMALSPVIIDTLLIFTSRVDDL